MNKELELWQFVSKRLKQNQSVMLLVVAESSGSSPGRQGYKMAVGADGELTGSIGGGVMEVRLVEQARAIMSKPPLVAGGLTPHLIEQVHQKNSPDASGMICSGKQIVVFRLLTSENTKSVNSIIHSLQKREEAFLTITQAYLSVSTGRVSDRDIPSENFSFEKQGETDFIYQEKVGFKNNLCIIGGGHCALALSELMSKMDFHISLFDDRPNLNTIDKNRFAHEIRIVESYQKIGDLIPNDSNIYVVIMTLGYKSDEIVIRRLLEKDFKYFGVLGSKAKMVTLLSDLRREGLPVKRLAKIHTPIGLPINSQTPEEIAISIAAEIISVKNK